MTTALLLCLIVSNGAILGALVWLVSELRRRPHIDSVEGASKATATILERLDSTSATTVAVASDLKTATVETAEQLGRTVTVAEELIQAQFARLDVLLDRLTGAVNRARTEASDTAAVVAADLEARTTAANTADKKAGRPAGAVADAGARRPAKRPPRPKR